MLQEYKSEWLWESHSKAARLQRGFRDLAVGERGVGQAGFSSLRRTFKNAGLCDGVHIGWQQDGLAKVKGPWDWFGGKVGLFHTL